MNCTQQPNMGVSPRSKATERSAEVTLLSLSEHYSEKRMLKKLAERGDTLPLKATRLDYARALESIYNYNMSEGNSPRLF